jgi:hypothetical protein
VTLNVRLQGGGGDSLDVVRAYATIQFPWDITAQVGRFPLDWEGAFYATDFAGYMMNDAYVTDYDPLATAIWFKKPFEMGSFEMFVAHNEQAGTDEMAPPDWPLNDDYYIYGARLAFDFNENFSAAVNYVKYDYQDAEDFSTLWGDIIVNFTDDIAFKAQYFTQELNGGWGPWDDAPSAWKAILTVGQDTLKFTDVWVEYAQLDENFLFANADPYAWTLGSSPFIEEYATGGVTYYDTTILNIVAHQKWNDQWWTYIRYLDVDADYDEGYSYKDYTASIRYNYTPNLWFELGYDKIEPDWDSGDFGDSLVWFRTTVNF